MHIAFSGVQAVGVISEADFIEQLTLILKHDWDFEIDRIDVRIKELELAYSKQRYSGLKLDLRSSIDFETRDRNRQTHSNSLYSKESDFLDRNLSIELSKQFLNNPSRLLLSIDKYLPKNNYKRFRQSSFYDQYETYGNKSQITVQWLIPILKQTNNPSDLRTYHRDRLDLEDAILSFLENQEDFIAEQLSDFYQLGSYQEQAKIYNSQIIALSQLLKSESDNPIPIERALIEIQKDAATNDRNQKSLREALSIRLDMHELNTIPVEVNFSLSNALSPDLLRQLESNNRSLKKIEIDKDLKEIDLKYYRNQTLPELNLALKASHDLQTSKTLSSHYKDATNDYGVSLEFELPILGYKSSNKSLAISKLQLAKHEHTYQRKKQELTADIYSLQQSLIDPKSIIISYEDLIASSVENRIENLKALHHKITSIDSVIDAYADEIRVKLDAIKARTDYQKDLINLKNLLDILLLSETHSPQMETIRSRL